MFSSLRTATVLHALTGAALVHAVMMAVGALAGFEPFLRGDRSGARLEAMQDVIQAPNLDAAIFSLINGDVLPGEYGLQLPFYMLAGPLGVVIFQTGLFLISLYCIWQIVDLTVKQPIARPIVSALYTLTPMTLTFTHQLTTEAIVTPFVVFFIFWAVRAVSGQAPRHAVMAGLCLGVVLLVRPGFVVIIPAVLALGGALYILRVLDSFKTLAIACVVAFVPLAGWTAIYTAASGEFGYTGGVANVGWNLRSKVFFVERANGRQGPPEVAAFQEYGELWSPQETGGGISITRYLTIAAAHPADYVKAGLADTALTFGRGGFSKLAVDYLGVARDKGIKEWRDVLDQGGVPALVQWSSRNLDILVVTGLELVSSIVSVALFLFAFAFVVTALLTYRSASVYLGQTGLTVVILAASLIAATLLSALVVDRAQPRLRNPADPAILLLAAIATGVLWPSLRARYSEIRFFGNAGGRRAVVPAEARVSGPQALG